MIPPLLAIIVLLRTLAAALFSVVTEVGERLRAHRFQRSQLPTPGSGKHLRANHSQRSQPYPSVSHVELAIDVAAL